MPPPLFARAVWDAAEAYLGGTYGFSIVDFVKNNPKELTIHFGGVKGQANRQRYMDLTSDMVDKDGQIKTLPVFGDIDLYTTRYTFSHHQGLLFATQYTQIALVVTEKAAFDDMKAKGLVEPEAAFAGQSLGEHSALAAIADVLPVSSLADVVFFRGCHHATCRSARCGRQVSIRYDGRKPFPSLQDLQRSRSP
ncbi:hypothetical protein QFC24_006441 [Naganishia onofrii]|uniref:Uncharacterized protein n=1 Tax=Naganishia onofrii TaxID=1851511 RepID=A0ACC2X3M5_9TREE|nr:hypothetical protein QFC24_006441 [Naganishia onofrii]